MIDLLLTIYSCVVTAFVVCLLLLMAYHRFVSPHRAKRAESLKNKYLQIAILSLISPEAGQPRFPSIRRRGARVILAEVIAGLVESTYGLDTNPLRAIVEHNHVDDYLMRCARCSSGYRRAYYLSMLSNIPVRKEIAAKTTRFDKSRNIYVRFYAMMVRVAADPATAVDAIEAYDHDLSVFEISEIMAMLRRGALPVAYEPLLDSDNRNLKMLGLSVVRRFGVEQAESDLLFIAGTEGASEFGIEALYALCSMRRPIAGIGAVLRCVKDMDRHQRKALLRYMAMSGYSVDALLSLFDRNEQPYLETIVNSYKRRIVS